MASMITTTAPNAAQAQSGTVTDDPLRRCWQAVGPASAPTTPACRLLRCRSTAVSRQESAAESAEYSAISRRSQIRRNVRRPGQPSSRAPATAVCSSNRCCRIRRDPGRSARRSWPAGRSGPAPTGAATGRPSEALPPAAKYASRVRSSGSAPPRAAVSGVSTASISSRMAVSSRTSTRCSSRSAASSTRSVPPSRAPELQRLLSLLVRQPNPARPLVGPPDAHPPRPDLARCGAAAPRWSARRSADCP